MALINMCTNAPTFPTAIDPIPTIIPIADSIKVILQAHPFPFQSPYAMTKYANPITTSNPPTIMPTTGNSANAVKPLKRSPIPPKMASIAIMVTPNGLCFSINKFN